MSPPSSGPQLPFPNLFAASAISACTAEALTLPLDTAKVRLQLQGGGAGGKYKGLLGTCMTIAKEEGPSALWKGLEPGLHRQVMYGGLRIGLYEPVKQFFVGKDHVGDVPLHLKIASGLATGAIAITVASPTDLVKVRMQSEGKKAPGQPKKPPQPLSTARTRCTVFPCLFHQLLLQVRMQSEGKKAPGQPKKYANAFKAYGIIRREEGLAGLWKGLGPNIARNAIINAAELASYDQIKVSLLATGYFGDNVVTHLVAGLGAGFFAVCVGSPVDVVKSRVMGDATGKYSGVLDCFVKTARNDGLLAFYNGFMPNFARLGSWNVAMFLMLEQMKLVLAPKSS
uniref:Uncoupling protein n=1 Tax=Tetradesmus obliquus TaxID=3088 RepID=A0A383VSA3_TETOB